MSAAYWRRAMNSVSAQPGAGSTSIQVVPGQVDSRPDSDERGWRFPVGFRHVAVLAAVLLYPWVATPFFTFQIGGQALVLGLIALSLTFLAGYGGMVSLAQMTVAGIAGYMVAIFGMSNATHLSLGWPWWLVVIVALVIATACAAFIGWISVRTEGIYTIMITLAIGVALHYLAQQNYTIFNGHQGFHEVLPPQLFDVDWRQPRPFYYLALFWAMAGYFFIKHLLRTPFGLALQGVRDNPRRMNALGFNVVAHRIAAYTVAGFMAAMGGVLLVWYNGLIAPGSIGTGALINVLVIAILGGIRHPVGPFIGAVVFVLMQSFGMDLAAEIFGIQFRERFNSIIGVVFLVIVLFSPDGLLGWWSALRTRVRGKRGDTGVMRQPPQ